jgi:hypothetical protein
MSEEPSRGAPGDPRVLASDADRERLIGELGEHSAAGRLTTDELEERTQAAYRARTFGELHALSADLPPTPTALGLAHAERRAQLTRRVVQETGGSAGAFVICTAIWLASGANGQFWPVWVLILVILSLVRNGWALYGPAADLDALESRLDTRRETKRTKSQLKSQALASSLSDRRQRELAREQHRAERRDRRGRG